MASRGSLRSNWEQISKMKFLVHSSQGGFFVVAGAKA